MSLPAVQTGSLIVCSLVDLLSASSCVLEHSTSFSPILCSE